MFAFLPGLPGGSEWLIILIIALLIFGSRLPSVMRSLGKSINEFKRGMEETGETAENQDEPEQEDEKTEEHSELAG
ncbi:MAG: twin-arginine translocase TatA/TatE family subunit [Candidatus Brocadiia bacterium]